jgi:hypothetical protein
MTDPQIERWGEEFASTSDRQVWDLLTEFRAEVLRDAAAVEFPLPIRADGTHHYISTGCLHGDAVAVGGNSGHEYCQGETGALGTKVPAQCKFCTSPCCCPCHGAPPAVAGPATGSEAPVCPCCASGDHDGPCTCGGTGCCCPGRHAEVQL